ncbi:unnamed protein product [Haemonchus placei]|uniref:Uncharacterized protein n=1 Tax=Haemonchus placei TaxID=6290 RepID=A0A3P7U5Q7_HAEPC|nr:unnamed protein product [Haemonchus placei]
MHLGDIDVSEANPAASRVAENGGENRPQRTVQAEGSENQDGNRLQLPVETKTSKNIEDLSRLAMFGKQNRVLRRFQIQHGQKTVAAGEVPSSASTTLSSRHTVQRQTPTRGTIAAPATSVQSSGFQQTGPVSNAGARLTSVSVRKRETIPNRSATHTAKMKPGSETDDVARSTPFDQANLAMSVNQVGVGSERRARDRAPRTNASSSAKISQRNGSGHIGRCPQPADGFLSSATVSSKNEYHCVLVTRVPSIARSTSTTRNTRNAASTALVVTSANRDTSIVRRLVASASRAGTIKNPSSPPGVTSSVGLSSDRTFTLTHGSLGRTMPVVSPLNRTSRLYRQAWSFLPVLELGQPEALKRSRPSDHMNLQIGSTTGSTVKVGQHRARLQRHGPGKF